MPPRISVPAACALAAALALGTAGCKKKEPVPEPSAAPAAEASQAVPDIAKRLAQFAPTPISADLTALSPEDRLVRERLIDAAKLLNEVYLRQAWTGNPEMRAEIERLTGPEAADVRDYFKLNFGPWDRLDNRKPFYGQKEHPKGAGYYPEDLTKEELEKWIADHPQDKDAFQSDVTVIRRDEKGGLKAIPYSQEYGEWLKKAAALLREASTLTQNASLKKFLDLRATAFENDKYFDSELAWMDLDAPVEVTIGPYETYEDDLFGFKAAFEGVVTVNLPEQSAALAHYKERLPWLEKNLPIPDSQKNPNRGSESPIRVVDVAYSAGDIRGGVHAIAFNLPNDEKVREAKGSKKVLLHNFIRAKYDKVLTPIAERVLVAEQVKDVTFEAYFDEVLHHELSHGLGPGIITVDGKKTEVRLELKELFATLEEAKADVMGVYNILALIGRKEMPAELRKSLEPTYVAGLFRAARFGLDEAHGQGTVAQFSYLLEKGALAVDESGKVRVVSEKFLDALRSLLHDMLTLQANGDYAGTKKFLETYGKPPQALRDGIAKLTDVPVDIRPIFDADK
jgi:hypothetical protein